MRRARTFFITLAAAGVAFAPAAGAASRPDFHDLGLCAPDVQHIELTPASEAYFAFSVPADCAPQTWDLYFEDLRGNGGKDVPAEGRREIGLATVTLPYVDPDTGETVAAWEQRMPYVGQAPCGAQLDLVLRGDDSPYAAAVVEADSCVELPAPPTLGAAQPRDLPPASDEVPSQPAGDVTPASPPPAADEVTQATAGGEATTDSLTPVAATPDQVVWSSTSTDRAALPDTGAGQTAPLAVAALCLLALGSPFAWIFRRKETRP